MKNVFYYAMLATAMLTTFAAPVSARLTPFIEGQASVIDGDTIEIHGERIRLHGIDAPESDQHCTDGNGAVWRCGKAAAFYLDDLIGQQTVSCEIKDEDQYFRPIAKCSIKGQDLDLNATLVEMGLAVAYRQFSEDYASQEEVARSAKSGVWNGPFMMPWDWRRR